MAPISLNDLAVQSYLFYSALLAVKLLLLAPLTAKRRLAKKVFTTEEDAKFLKGIVGNNDPDVERVRRAHLNDLENIPVFWVLGALYLTTGPAAAWATTLFRTYAVGRVLHTMVYAITPLPQPARGLAWLVPFLITLYMAVQVILHYSAAL